MTGQCLPFSEFRLFNKLQFTLDFNNDIIIKQILNCLLHCIRNIRSHPFKFFCSPLFF